MPVRTSRLAFTHMPKTGGDWVQRQLRQAYGTEVYCRGHEPLWAVRAHEGEFREGRIAFGNVRGPWAWYASWYLHSLRHGRAVTKYGATFKEVLRKFVQPTEVHPSALGPGLFFRSYGGKWDADGLFSFAHRNQFCDPANGEYLVDYLVDTRLLSAGLVVLCEAAGHDPVAFGPPSNRAPDYAPQAMYDDEMLDWVYAADSAIIDRFGLRPFNGSGALLHRVQ